MVYLAEVGRYAASNYTQPGAADGIWTGVDWTNDTYNVGVANGLPYGTTPAMNARI